MRPAILENYYASPAFAGLTHADDGRCHNSETGFFDHECSEPAEWIGTKPSGYRMGFCDHCKRHGREAKPFTSWERAVDAGGAA